jgi:hypothetical protein
MAAMSANVVRGGMVVVSGGEESGMDGSARGIGVVIVTTFEGESESTSACVRHITGRVSRNSPPKGRGRVLLSALVRVL